MKKLTSMLEDELLTPRSGPVPYGRKKQFPVAKMMPLLAATFMFAMAGATLGQGGGEPASVLYWDGSSLNVIGPTSGYLIPAARHLCHRRGGWRGVAPGHLAGPDHVCPEHHYAKRRHFPDTGCRECRECRPERRVSDCDLQ